MRALQLTLFQGVERVRLRTEYGIADGSVVRDVAKPRAGYHGRLALVRFDLDAGSYADCLLIVDLAHVEELREFVPLVQFRREEAERVARGESAIETALEALRARYTPKRRAS